MVTRDTAQQPNRAPAIDPAVWAQRLGVSREAVDIYLSSHVVDLHVDSFIWHRLLGYGVLTRRETLPLGGRFLGHVDLPRLLEARASAFWVVTTNPLRTAQGRLHAIDANIRRLAGLLGSNPRVALCRTFGDYHAARAAGRYAAFIAVQGGNAFDADLTLLERLPPGLLLRVTLVHLSSSAVGRTSSPFGFRTHKGLTVAGRQLVQQLNALRILVDLAHIHPDGFWDAVRAHDSTQPLVVTHTGVSAVYPHWRNVDDSQLRAIADTGGVVGVMFHMPFLADRASRDSILPIVLHLEHIVRVLGEDFAALGSDWDGAINPPPGLRTCLDLPRLVEHMLLRRWSPETIRKVLGGNALRVLKHLRP